ncbi:hypothetical protein [Pectobacterium brasiliense]|uniref:hypothetical protein n=1 Tax=Pectobacterium brasiliense TaxID=180957 RepID=UPI001968DB70|nr:hypothetical protein [Pectobacterium brasiliense]MBN3261772.1 hypothetical protein [Pectobacterium brasiliense]
MATRISMASSSLAKGICSREIKDLAFTYVKKSLIGFFTKGVANEYINISFKDKTVSIKKGNLFSSIDKAVSTAGVNKKNEWFKEETINLLSCEINRIIDVSCKKNKFQIKEKDRSDIFNKISSGLGILKLDSKCTQSSIIQILNNDKNILNKIERLFHKEMPLSEQCQLRNRINDKLVNVIFMEKFGAIDLDILRYNTAKEISLIMKKYNIPARIK